MHLGGQTRKIAVGIAVVLVVLLAGVSAFAITTVRESFPEMSGRVQLNGLDGDVEVLRDAQGIPQIYADSAADLFMAQGYVHAQDRFFEMDFRRHVTAGRLAELFGRTALETDKFVRTLGWRRVAEQELGRLSPEAQRYLRAYAAGVNAYIEDRSPDRLSLEYSVLALDGLDYQPEAWTAVDSLAWLKAMAWDLRSNMADEIDRVLATEKMRPRQVGQLYPSFPYGVNDPIVTSGAVAGGRFDQDAGLNASDVRQALAPVSRVADVAATLPTLLGTGEGIGSNAWAVSGDLSATGRPLLANDPHLAPSMPGIWYEMGLHCREVSADCPFDVTGFTFSGMPGVVIGHNADIAWGITTMYPDVTDLYLERVVDDTYRYAGRTLPLTTRTEAFAIAGEERQETITVRSTRHGPIISDVDDTIASVGDSQSDAVGRSGERLAVSLQWTALQPGRTMDALFEIDKSSGWQEFRAAAEDFDVPSQNLVYADREGHIGYQAPGLVPIRKKGDGTWPVPGWDPSYGWKGYIPFRELPSVLDPAKGYVVTSNQQVIGPEYPYLIGTGQAPGYRSQRIIDMIESRAPLSVDAMADMQLDTYNSSAAILLPYVMDLPLASDYDEDGQQLLEDWDLHQDADSGAAAYYAALWRNVLARTFHDQLSEDVWPDGGERWFEVMRGLLKKPNSIWWDDATTKGVRERRDQILTQALKDARDEMTRRQSLDPGLWTWGRIHRLSLVNQSLGTSGVSVVEKLFNRGPYELPGGGGIVDALAWDASEGYDVVAVPSMRMVVDLDALDESRWIQLTGQSGHAFHGNYTDQTDLWARGETLPWAYSREAVEARSEDRLVLSPDSPTSP